MAADHTLSQPASPGSALAVSVAGFFMVTFDAVVVNVALPTIRADLGGGISGLQWVVDGYTLLFAALLLTAGALSDRLGAKRAFTVGLAVFVAASAVCGVSVSLPMLIAARFVQGAAAAVMMPASMALVGEAYTEPRRRTQAFATWAMGGAVASSSAPILGGLLTLVSWRAIFFINVPVGIAALIVHRRTSLSPERPAPIDWPGQVAAVAAMGGLVFGAIEAGSLGIGSWPVITALAGAVVSLAVFVIVERQVAHPMLPPRLIRQRSVRTATAIGFAFMVGYYGLPFIFSLYFQQVRGRSALMTGVLFLPMFIIGFVLTPFSARLAERVGTRRLIGVGLVSMAAGLAALGLVVDGSSPEWLLSILMVLVGLGGPFVIPMTTALLLETVPSAQAGTASGIFNTGRQVGGALAVAFFGALLTNRDSFVHGQRIALLLAAAVLVAATAASRALPRPTPARVAPDRSTSSPQPTIEGVVHV